MDSRRSANAWMTSILLFVLVALNAFWFTVSGLSGPLYGVAFYAAVVILCWWKAHFGAAIAAGIAGVAVHVVELVLLGVQWLSTAGKLCMVANLVIPVFVVHFAVKARRAVASATHAGGTGGSHNC